MKIRYGGEVGGNSRSEIWEKADLKPLADNTIILNGGLVQPRDVIHAMGGFFPFHTPGISGAISSRWNSNPEKMGLWGSLSMMVAPLR